MHLIKPTTWNEIFNAWREREADNPGWVKCATEIKGWPDWESWRRFTAEQFKADERDWEIYQFDDPFAEVPEMLLGPFSGWQSRVPEKNKMTFQDLLEIDEQRKFFENHQGVRSMVDGLPFSTELIGLKRKDNDKIVCIEGHHRAVVITLLKMQGKEIDFSQVQIRIALATLGIEESLLLDYMLERGTNRIE